jgi:hypothetical protein
MGGPEQGEPQGVQLQQMVDLAGVENDEMLRGNPIGPTPFASVVHTQIHIDFIKSKKFKEEVPPGDEEILKIFSTHITGEIAAQMMREQGAQAQGSVEANQPQAMPGGNGQVMPSQEGNMGTVVPGRMMGGDEVPSGMPGAKSGVQIGRKV